MMVMLWKSLNECPIVISGLLLTILMSINLDGAQATPGLMLPEERTTGMGCLPEGRTVSYECTVEDTSDPSSPTGSTFWQGSALMCPGSSNQIILPHFQYNGTMSPAVDMCEDVSATSIGVSGTEYTSRLDIPATVARNGTTIQCALGANVVGTDIVTIGVIPPPPLSITLSLSSSLLVSWSPPSGPVEGGVGGYEFRVIGEGCGCMNMTVSATTSVTCSGWTANGQNCTFEVRTLSEDCGLVSDPVTESVAFIVPSAPTEVSIKSVYNVDGSAQYIDVEFIGVDSMIGSTISNSVSYAVRFGQLEFTEGVTCNATDHCNLRVTDSQLTTASGLLNVSVVASNAVGSGPPATASAPVAVNIVNDEVVQVQVDVPTSSVACNLLNSFPVTSDFICSISYGPAPDNCSFYTNSSTQTNGSPGEVVTILLNIDNGTDYCYTVSMNARDTAICVSGTFSSSCDPSELGDNPVSGSVPVPNGVITYNGVTFGSTAQLMCDSGYEPAAGTSNRTCMSDGRWSGGTQSCVAIASSFSWWIILIVIICVALLTAVIVVAGCCGRHFYLKKKGSSDAEKKELTKSSSPPPKEPNPNTIEHETTATGDMYAMVDMKGKKGKPKQTQQAALYQDPNAIAHQTTPTGDMYAVVDKPKRGSSKKREPDVVPTGSEGLTYADIDVAGASRRKPKPAPQQQSQDPARVEYADVTVARGEHADL